jgi:hypothetical protein
MIYITSNEMVVLVSDDQLNVEDSWRCILRRHFSYFADEDVFNGYLQHIRDEGPFYECMIGLVDDFLPGNRLQSFESWEYVDPIFKDLVLRIRG